MEQRIRQQEIKVEIQGISPLLFNRFLESDIIGKSKRKAGAESEKIIEDKLYILEGKIYTPSTHILGSLINAAKNFQIKGKGKSNYSRLVGSSVEVKEDAIIHKYQGWVAWRISAVNPMTKGRMIVTRPRMEKWAFEFTLVLRDESIGIETIKEILDYAGSYVGIGDWRPEKKGKFGKFIVTEFKPVI